MSNELGMRIRTIREEKQMRQADVAEVLQITASAYGHYEQGKREPDFQTLKKIAALFEVRLSYLLGETDDQRPFSQAQHAAEPAEELYFNKIKGFEELDEEGQKKAQEYIEFLKLKHSKK